MSTYVVWSLLHARVNAKKGYGHYEYVGNSSTTSCPDGKMAPTVHYRL